MFFVYMPLCPLTVPWRFSPSLICSIFTRTASNCDLDWERYTFDRGQKQAWATRFLHDRVFDLVTCLLSLRTIAGMDIAIFQTRQVNWEPAETLFCRMCVHYRLLFHKECGLLLNTDCIWELEDVFHYKDRQWCTYVLWALWWHLL